MSYCQRLIITGILIITVALGMQDVVPVHAGEYLNSAHGSDSYGVSRPSMTGYTTGNCGHCHDMHSSVSGEEPAPKNGAPSEYTLFSKNFNTSATPGFYQESDNFCFYCHSDSASVQRVTNGDYATTFGGGISGTLPQYIMEAFNQQSFHNLDDIHTFVNNENSLFPWYNSYSNPCNSCHNPHLAKKNYDYLGAPTSPPSAISKPSDHFNLWGETELMSSYSSYEAPYANSATESREPDGSNTSNGSKTPDYVGFCSDCHNSNTTILSTSLGRNLLDIDWSSGGDKHGGFMRDVGIDALEPYATATATKSNLILSCLDCHEPHGSSNIMLLRSRVNGDNLNATITSTDVMGSLCRQCHQDDAAANRGTNTINKWEYIHHIADDHPYTQFKCGTCHLGSSNPIPCGQCHMHGMTDPKGTGRKTF